jgi:hypothetical protein
VSGPSRSRLLSDLLSGRNDRGRRVFETSGHVVSATSDPRHLSAPSCLGSSGCVFVPGVIHGKSPELPLTF